jgi:hypothetical protein
MSPRDDGDAEMRAASARDTLPGHGRRVLIVVENLPVPFDRRVWAEATTLAAAGYTVSVICPTGKGHEAAYEHLDGVHVYRHPLPLEGHGAFGYLREYGAALFHELRLALKVRRERGIDILHGCNPPDLIFLVAWALGPSACAISSTTTTSARSSTRPSSASAGSSGG